MNLKLIQNFGKGRVQEVALKSKLHRKSVSGKSHRQWQSWGCGLAIKPVLSASGTLRLILALNLAPSHTHSPATRQLPTEPIAQRGKLRQAFYSRYSKRISNQGGSSTAPGQ